jgi:hypothetical protein
MIMYKALASDGREDYYDADNADMALAMGIIMFGDGVAVRPAFYGEWDCGNDCGYDISGNHYWTMPDGSRTYDRNVRFAN